MKIHLKREHSPDTDTTARKKRTSKGYHHWTEEDFSQLKKGVTKYGYCWQKISKEVFNEAMTPNQLSSQWNKLLQGIFL